MKTSHYKVQRSRAGLGLFATDMIKKGDFIIEYTGERISSDEADIRGGKYLFTLSDDVVVDGKGRNNLARYINHSCRPNCEAEIDEEEDEINIYAIKNIRPGDELTYDYGKEYWLDHCQPCRCNKCKPE